MARSEITYSPVDDLPKSSRTREAGGTHVSPYEKFIAECRANPGQWFMSPAANANAAYSRASTLRKHGLIAHARGTEVYVCADADSF
jgi:hypothetical protein